MPSQVLAHNCTQQTFNRVMDSPSMNEVSLYKIISYRILFFFKPISNKINFDLKEDRDSG